MTCAIYAGCASQSQRTHSIEEQIRTCKNFADQRGWTVLSECIIFGEAVSGLAPEKMGGLHKLLSEAEGNPRPFSRILVTDISRLGRSSDAVQGVIAALQRQRTDVFIVESNTREMTAADHIHALRTENGTVRRIFQMLTDGVGLREIVKKLNRKLSSQAESTHNGDRS